MSIFDRWKDAYEFGQAVGEELEARNIGEEDVEGEGIQEGIQYAADEQNVVISTTLTNTIFQIGVRVGRRH